MSAWGTKLRDVPRAGVDWLGHRALRRTLREEAGSSHFDRNERLVEYAFALDALREIEGRELLDVGTGKTAWPHLMANCGFLVRAVDDYGSYWGKRPANRHFEVLHQDITRPTMSERFDAITCISVLEHIPEHGAAMRGMFGLLRPGGRLIVTFPYNERSYHPDAYSHPDAGYGQQLPYIAQIFSRAELDLWLAEGGASLVRKDLYEVFSGELWTQGERLPSPRLSSPEGPHHLGCVVIETSAR